MTERLPAGLGVRREPPSTDACQCFCGPRHRANLGACAGDLLEGTVRVWVNSLHGDGSGFAICEPGAQAWPDIELAPNDGSES
jgi:hypothetical protein